MTNADFRPFVPLAVPEIRGQEWAYVKECLDTGWVSSVGSFVDRFEGEFAAAVDSPHSVAMASGTAALHVALIVAGVRPGDLVLVPTLTFIASINAISYVGAAPVLIDAEPEHWQMDPARVEEFLRRECERRNGEFVHRDSRRRVGAIMTVDLLGHPCDYSRIRPLADEFGLPIVEDATESLGAQSERRPVGIAGDVACFSFNGNKMITTGGGGMLVTAREDWARRARHLSTQAKADPVEYVHDEIGFNYRLTNIQAAIGCAQLEQLDAFVGAKRAIAHRYDEALRDLPGVTPQATAEGVLSASWLYSVRVDERIFGMSAREVMADLGHQRIQSRPLFQPAHLGEVYSGAIRVGGSVAEQLWDEGLSLPCSVGLLPADQQRVIDALWALQA